MRKILSIICLVLIALLFPAAGLVSRGLPADTKPYVAKKYHEWNGVLRAWVCSGWQPGGSFTRWLNGCAAEFEKAHDGVYIEFTQVSPEAMANMWDSGIRPPELLFFSPGVLSSGDGLTSLQPVAMGGYIWVYNRALCGEISGEVFAMIPDDGARSFSAAQLALIPNANITNESNLEMDPGIDLGLPASAKVSTDALDAFKNGELPALVVSQRELAQLIRLRDGGRGPDWACAAAGEVAYTDQLLFAAAVEQADGRQALAEDFIDFLLEEAQQLKLADIGAFSPKGFPVHPGHSPYAALDALLCSRERVSPGVFSDPAGWSCAELLPQLKGGQFSASEAALKLRLKFTGG